MEVIFTNIDLGEEKNRKILYIVFFADFVKKKNNNDIKGVCEVETFPRLCLLGKFSLIIFFFSFSTFLYFFLNINEYFILCNQNFSLFLNPFLTYLLLIIFTLIMSSCRCIWQRLYICIFLSFLGAFAII